MANGEPPLPPVKLTVPPAAEDQRLKAVGLALLGLAVFAVATVRQLGVWENSFTLFSRAVAVTADNYVAHDNRGLYLYKAGRVEEAMADYRRALAINPAYLNANNNLGHALSELGRIAATVGAATRPASG